MLLTDYLALAVIGGLQTVQTKLESFVYQYGADQLFLLS